MNAAIDALRKEGGVVLYPTETLYGLGESSHDVRSAVKLGRSRGEAFSP